MFMNVEFESVSLISNYKKLNEKSYLIKANISFYSGRTYLIKGSIDKYMLGPLLMGYIEPTFGTIKVGEYILKRGKYLKNIKDYRKNIAYLPFDYNEMFNYKLVNNIFKEALYNFKYKTIEDDKLVMEIIENTGCYLDYKKEKLENLDSITRYKLYLASILIYDPQIIILEKIINDEKIMNYLNYLAHEKNKIVIFVGNYKIPVDNTYVINNHILSEVK